MSAAQKRRTVTLEEYFAIEERAERKSEYHNGEMFLMAGASREHNILSRNLSGLLFARLQGSDCQTFISDLRVRVQRTGLYTYPRPAHRLRHSGVRTGEPRHAHQSQSGD